jgi:hypothetical protein
MNILFRNSKQNSFLYLCTWSYWNSGTKGTYDLLGRNFARKGSCYSGLYFKSKYGLYGIAKQIAAIQWTKDSISKFKGNPNEVLSPDIQQGTLGRIGRMNPSMELT